MFLLRERLSRGQYLVQLINMQLLKLFIVSACRYPVRLHKAFITISQLVQFVEHMFVIKRNEANSKVILSHYPYEMFGKVYGKMFL